MRICGFALHEQAVYFADKFRLLRHNFRQPISAFAVPKELPIGDADLAVIEAAYYALSRFVAANAGAIDDWGGKTSIAFCAACGNAFIKLGNRQKYCLSPQGQSIRSQLKSKEYYYRERQKKSMKC